MLIDFLTKLLVPSSPRRRTKSGGSDVQVLIALILLVLVCII
jgi:hypothetical protein